MPGSPEEILEDFAQWGVMSLERRDAIRAVLAKLEAAREWKERWRALARFRGWPESRHEKNRQVARRAIRGALQWLELAPIEKRRNEAIAVLREGLQFLTQEEEP